MTDNRTVLDFEMPRTVHRRQSLNAATFWKNRHAISPDLLNMEGEDSIVDLVDWPDDEPSASRLQMESIEGAKRLVLAGHRSAVEENATEQSRLYDEALAATPGFTTARYYATLNRIERAEAAISGDTALATTLVLGCPTAGRSVSPSEPPCRGPLWKAPPAARFTISFLARDPPVHSVGSAVVVTVAP
jgi:hypothetical protein